MLSPEFGSAIKAGNLLRTRIMLKDSLIVDPTFVQFNEMLAYARQALPELLIPFDGGTLENDQSKWNKDLMNMELVEIVSNFSETRIDHLKKVINLVLAEKIRLAKEVKQPTQQERPSPRPASSHPLHDFQASNPFRNYSPPEEIEEQKKAVQKQALSQITNCSKKIESVMTGVQSRGKWLISDIQELENAANQMLLATRNYKNNR